MEWNKAQKCRNTSRIANFCNKIPTKLCRKTSQMPLCGVALRFLGKTMFTCALFLDILGTVSLFRRNEKGLSSICSHSFSRFCGVSRAGNLAMVLHAVPLLVAVGRKRSCGWGALCLRLHIRTFFRFQHTLIPGTKSVKGRAVPKSSRGERGNRFGGRFQCPGARKRRLRFV